METINTGSTAHSHDKQGALGACCAESAAYTGLLCLSPLKKIISCHPLNLPLADHVDCFVALNRSPSRLEFSEALLSVHATFDRSMILFENVV